MLEQEKIKYLEKPITFEEKAIAALLEKVVRAIAVRDVDLLVSAYSDNASIEILSLREAPISKIDYRERMLKFIKNIRNFYICDVIIRVNEKEAVISCITAVSLKEKAFLEKNQRYFKCIKEGGEWHIVDARYI